MDIKLSEVIKNQAIINIGCTGHVANGKSTIVYQMTGIKTQKFSKEKERNITINIGYANAKIFYSPELDIYKSVSSKTKSLKDKNGNDMKLIGHISFVDCPGHEAFMSNMLGGSSVMDQAILVEAANANNFPQVQTREHLIALQNTDIKDLLVIQNKCDIVNKNKLSAIKYKLEEFLEDFYEHTPVIIPVIAQNGDNIDYVSNYLANSINSYNKDLNKKLRANIIRTFDINKPYTKINDLRGGVLGGSIMEGVLKQGDYIQILPGRIVKNENSWQILPIYTTVKSIYSDKNKMNFAIPGGLIGIGTNLDPGLCKNNNLIGQLITYPNDKLPIVYKLEIKYKSIKREGIKTKLKLGESVIIGMGSNFVKAKIEEKSSGLKTMKIKLELPLCIFGNKVTVLNKNSKIAALGKITNYKVVENVLYREDLENQKIIYNVINDLKDEYKFNYSFDYLANSLSYKKILKKKYDIPDPVLSNSRKKGIYYLQNFNRIVEKSKNEKDKVEFQEIFIKCLEKLFGNKITITKDSFLKIQTSGEKLVIKNNITKLIKNIKKCKTCGSINTFLVKHKRNIKINCISCNSIINLV